MSFRDNLKQELSLNGMLVKELAALAGIQKRALDTYLLSENASMPPADAAIRIASVLGVSVEYLITGEELSAIPHNAQRVIRRFLQLNEKDRKIVSVLIDALLENHVDRN